jgi:hypothetical protein
MLPTKIHVGYVFRYSYLWHRQYLDGREEGDKDRPCLVLAFVIADDEGSPVVRVLPITHTPPAKPEEAVQIPHPVKQRLRLDDARSWIVLTESNRFIRPGPDLRPVNSNTGCYGAVPPVLFAELKRRFLAFARAKSHGSVTRTQ